MRFRTVLKRETFCCPTDGMIIAIMVVCYGTAGDQLHNEQVLFYFILFLGDEASPLT